MANVTKLSDGINTYDIKDNNAVHKSGDETISGTKTFDNGTSQNRIIFQMSDVVLGETDVTANHFTGYKTLDANGTEFANCNSSYRNDGSTSNNFYVVNKKADGTSVSGSLGIYATREGEVYAQAPTVTNINDSSTKIVTTEFLNGTNNNIVHKSGDETIAGIKTFSSPIDGTISTTVAAGSTKELLRASVADNDNFRLIVGGALNAGYAELATADDGNEPIYVRQYTDKFATLKRTATLLDGSGNTSFPGTVTANVLDGSLVSYQSHNGETGNLYRKLGEVILTGTYQSVVVPFFYYKDAVNTSEVGYQGKISLRVHSTAGVIDTGNTGVVLSEYPDWINNGNVIFYVLYKNNTPEENQATCEIWSYVKNAWDGFKIVPMNYHGYGRNYWTWYNNIAGVESLPEGYSQIAQKYGIMYTTEPSEDTTSSKQVDTVGARNTKLSSYALDSNVVHKTGKESITGEKSFTNGYIQIKNNSISYTDTTKSQNGQNYINFWATDRQTGYINSYLQSSTQTSTNITAYFNDGTDTNQAKLTLYANKDGTKSGVLNFSPTEDTNSSTQIDTVGARNTKLANYALDNNVVKLTGDQNVSGTKTFNTAPRFRNNLTNSLTLTANEEQGLLNVSLNTDDIIDGASIIRIVKYNANGENRRFVAYRAGFRKADDSGNHWPGVFVGVDTDGKTFGQFDTQKAFAPTPSTTTSTSDTYIATTGWVNGVGNNIVHLIGDETVAGIKTFSDNIKANTSITIGQHSVMSYNSTTEALEFSFI